MSGDMKLVKKCRDRGEFCLISLVGSKIRPIYIKLCALSKYLFPILTCLIVAGAVVLPPYISHIRDERQFYDQIHTSELNADALPVWESRNLLERMKLYARWETDRSAIIPSLQTVLADEESENMELAEQILNRALDYMIQAGVLPADLFEFPFENTVIKRVLLWDTDSMNSRNSAEYWSLEADFGDPHLWIIIDSESGLPLKFSLSDYNMAQWLVYQDPDTLPDLAERFFDLLDLYVEMEETDIPSDASPWERYFCIRGTAIRYRVFFNATILDISFEVE